MTTSARVADARLLLPAILAVGLSLRELLDTLIDLVGFAQGDMAPA